MLYKLGNLGLNFPNFQPKKMLFFILFGCNEYQFNVQFPSQQNLEGDW